MKMCKSLFVAMAMAVAAWAQDEMGPVESPAVEMPMMKSEPGSCGRTCRSGEKDSCEEGAPAP